ncbi:MAG: DUF1684 domain-containing protein [Candidatus Latescibacterota bacterium]|nr:DUF1684 domain-containing protein [Candidatus Latescibacterota bacterium]
MILWICASVLFISHPSFGWAQKTGPSQYLAEIKQFRTQKDSVFKYGPDSPIAKDQRSSFEGLNYFPVDYRFRIAGELHRYARLRRIEVPSTNGNTIIMERFGRIYFQWSEKTFWLEAYRSLETAQIEAFFTDDTNGKDTYQIGRYVQLMPIEDGLYTIDFNHAYNPYCIYDNLYVCPLPPPNNHLPFEITAGELNFGTVIAQ